MGIRYHKLTKEDKRALQNLRAFQILCGKKLKEERNRK